MKDEEKHSPAFELVVDCKTNINDYLGYLGVIKLVAGPGREVNNLYVSATSHRRCHIHDYFMTIPDPPWKQKSTPVSLTRCLPKN